MGVVSGARAPHITIDMRMLGVSGIGTYLEELVPRVIAQWTSARFTLLGRPRDIAVAIQSSERVAVQSLDATIYSVREQLALLRSIPRQTTLFWAPHYNIPLLYRGRLAVTVHDVFHLADRPSSMARRLYARTVFARVRARAEVVMCDSAFTVSELRRLSGEPRRVAVIPLGVAPRWFDVQAHRPKPEAPYFLALGNVKPHKNLARLVAAFGAVAGKLPHRLVVVGRREGLRTLDHVVHASAAALGDRVIFTGHVEREHLEAWVAGCAALIQPSLYEGFGLPPLEAMACGRRVAVSRTSSLPEVCGAEAVYFDPLDEGSIAEALVLVAPDSAHEADDARRRRAWARTFDWDVCAEATVAHLARAAGASA